MKSILLLLFVAVLSSGCMEFNQNEVVFNHELVGVWSNVEWNESGIRMEKVKKLEKNTYGYVFNSNGTMMARQNAGWCGTPPIVTADYDGTWKLEDGKILISLEYWGGQSTQEWVIANQNNKQVTIHITNAEYHQRD